MSQPFTFASYHPGVIADIIALHMAYYGPTWGFGRAFEAKLAEEMGEFHRRYHDQRDLFTAAYDDGGRLLGTVTVDGVAAHQEGAHLRWFIVAEAARGQGLGAALMARVEAFLTERGYGRAYLTTFRGLDAARALYERHGFQLVAEEAVDPWSGDVGLQRFERREPPRPETPHQRHHGYAGPKQVVG
ncbi:MAG: GNAT family N-acetyltransferase [Candidatus Competibacterales bacterium]